MPDRDRIVSPTFPYDHVQLEDGSKVRPPEGWILVPPGDAGLTRRIKAGGPTWTVQQKVGRRMMSRGVWAPADRVERIRAELEAERSTEQYAKRREADVARRERKQGAYEVEFKAAVLGFLAFHPQWADLADRLATAVTEHAVPVGSGTVARTERIPVEQRAEAAVIAWMRHQTTAYDSMNIARVKGRRREVRSELAAHSRRLLAMYRTNRGVDVAGCPLQRALDKA